MPIESGQLNEEFIAVATTAIEIAGVFIILIGTAFSSFAFGWQTLRRSAAAYERFRRSLSRSILLGLEFLVAADIIGTVAIKPDLRNVSALGLIVLIRTFLSVSLEVEIEGRWPWRKPAGGGGSGQGADQG